MGSLKIDETGATGESPVAYWLLIARLSQKNIYWKIHTKSERSPTVVKGTVQIKNNFLLVDNCYIYPLKLDIRGPFFKANKKTLVYGHGLHRTELYFEDGYIRISVQMELIKNDNPFMPLQLLPPIVIAYIS